MNKKGFMMAEVVVVSAVVLVTLVGLYASYNKIYSTYKTRLSYYDVVTLYRLGYYRDILNVNNVLGDVMTDSESGIVTVYDSDNTSSSIFSLPVSERTDNTEDSVYMVNNGGSSINSNVFDNVIASGKKVNPTFIEYVDFLEKSVNFGSFDYMLLMERCNVLDDGRVDIDDCNYAYLEIPR